MLRLVGEDVAQKRIERLTYAPGLQDSGDLESGTKSVTATVEATGVGNADYSAALALPSPADARIVVDRIAARLAATIDSMTAGQLNCRVYVDVQDSDHRLFDLSWTSTGSKLAAVDTHSASLATIFGLLGDGASHTLYFFFWGDTGNAVISLVQLWEAVGTADGAGWGQPVLSIAHKSWFQLGGQINREGSGNFRVSAFNDAVASEIHRFWETGSTNDVRLATGPLLTDDKIHVWFFDHTVSTDLVYLKNLGAILRSEA